MSLSELVSISRFYGAGSDFVIAGGGNTSWKDGDSIYVKGSGTSLGSIAEEGFVKMKRSSLAEIWEKRYSDNSAAREAEALADMMAARFAGEENKRPSVETLLHDLLPFSFVVHTHPALVNGITCSREGESAVKNLFDSDRLPYVWVPVTDPGYVLAKAVKIKLYTYAAENGSPPGVVFLQNHGIFVGADSLECIREIYDFIMNETGAAIKRQPDFSGEIESYENSGVIAESIRGALSECYNEDVPVLFLRNNEIARLTKNRAAFSSVESAFTPDQIVYAGSDPLFIEKKSLDNIAQTIKAHKEHTGRIPKIIAVEELGVFGAGPGGKTARLALMLFKDAARISCYSESFGGPQFMPREKINFINNWEVERYRASVST